MPCAGPGGPEANNPDISDDGEGGGKWEGDGAPGTAIEPVGGAIPLIEDP